MTGRDRRALSVGAGVVAAAILVLRILPWAMRSTLGAEARLYQEAALLARARADFAATALLHDSTALVAQALVGLAPKLLNGSVASEAVADLSGRVALAASRHTAKLDRIEQVPDSVRAGRLRRVVIRAALECDVQGLLAVVRALEFGSAALAVQELRVTAIDPTSGDRAPEVLRVEATVGGWFVETATPRAADRGGGP